jgi:type I restriction enzyme M protein
VKTRIWPTSTLTACAKPLATSSASKFTLKSLLGNPSRLEANLRTTLLFFRQRQEIVDKFDLRNQIRKDGAVGCAA